MTDSTVPTPESAVVARRPHASTPVAQLLASRDEYRQHIEAQDFDAELLTFLAGVVDSIALEVLHRERLAAVL